MILADPLTENLEIENQDAWDNKRTPTNIGCFAA